MWLLAALAALLLIIAAVLAVPLNIQFQLQREARLRWRLWMNWLFGLIKVDLGRRGKEKPEREKEAPGKPPSKKPPKVRLVVALMGNRAFLKGLVTFLKRSWTGLVWRHWSLDLRFGFADPADTGVVWGVIGAPLMYSGRPASRLRIQPDFAEERLQFHLQGTVRISPLRFVAALMAFLLRPATIRAAVAFARAQRRA